MLLALLQQAAIVVITPPTAIAPGDVLVAPTAACREATLADAAPPSAPRTFRFQCVAEPDGAVRNCIAAEDGGTSDAKEFRRRLVERWSTASADPLLRIAERRIYAMRVRSDPGITAPTRSFLVDETVSAADAVPAITSAGQVTAAQLGASVIPGADITSYYPPSAIRAGLNFRAVGYCRVLQDLSLLCDVAPPVGSDPAAASTMKRYGFDRATRLAFAMMRARPKLDDGTSTVGRMAELTFTWLLPS